MACPVTPISRPRAAKPRILAAPIWIARRAAVVVMLKTIPKSFATCKSCFRVMGSTANGSGDGKIAMGARIRELREARKLSINKLAKLVGVSRPAVTQWEQGRTAPTHENVQALASALGVSVSEIYPPSGDTATRLLSSVFAHSVPMLEWHELKRWPGEAAIMLAGQNREFIQLSRESGEHSFALRIEDNSLDPYISIGDEVVIDPSRSPQQNKLVLVRIEATGQELIRWYDPRRGGAYDLRPEHPSFPTITINADNPAEIVGVVIRILKYVD